MHSIKTKIILSLLSVVISVLSFYEINSYLNTQDKLFTELESTADRQIIRLSEGLSLPLWEMDEAWQTKVLVIEMMKDDVYAITVRDDQQAVRGKIKNKQGQLVDTNKEVQVSQLVFHHDNSIQGVISFVFTTTFFTIILFTVSTMFFMAKKKLVLVSLYLNPHFIEEQLYQEAINRLIALITLSLAITITLVIILNRIVIKPLQHILRVIEAITHGDYSDELVLKQTDEIGSLAMGVIEMKHAIQERESTILKSENDYRVLSEQLEQRVIERTQTLESNNRKLYAVSLDLQETKDKAETANRAKSIFLANIKYRITHANERCFGFFTIDAKKSRLNDYAT